MDIVAPLIAGRRFSYSSIELALVVGATYKELVVDVSNITYSESLEIAQRYGAARIPIGSTSGVWQPQEGTLTLGKSAFTRMATLVGPGWLGINMLMTLAYFDYGEPLTTEVIIARITGRSNTHAQSPEALEEELRFMPVAPILINGVPSMLNRVI